MKTRRPVDGEVHVHYGQLSVESDPEVLGPDLTEAFAGQRAGLCGASVPGALYLTTGLHTGHVAFTVEVHDRAPVVDPAWEEVVEVSFRPASAHTFLVEWAGEASWELLLEETDYRVRYCATNMDAARQQDTRLDGEPQLDRYLLQFWPAPPEPDRLLKQTSDCAAYWHEFARKQPAPPTPDERAEAERQARLAQQRAAEEHRLAYELWEWGGQLPSQRLRDVQGNVHGLLEFDAALLHAIDAAGPRTQRAVALLAARRACEAAGLAELDWVAAALTALRAGRPLPAPYDDPERMWEMLESDPRVPDRTVGEAVPPPRPPFQPPEAPDAPHTTVAHTSELPQALSHGQGAPLVVGLAATAINPPGPPEAQPPEAARHLSAFVGPGPFPPLRISRPHVALPALIGAAEADPLLAAIDAVFAAIVSYGPDYQAVLDEVRTVCPPPR